MASSSQQQRNGNPTLHDQVDTFIDNHDLPFMLMIPTPEDGDSMYAAIIEQLHSRKEVMEYVKSRIPQKLNVGNLKDAIIRKRREMGSRTINCQNDVQCPRLCRSGDEHLNYLLGPKVLGDQYVIQGLTTLLDVRVCLVLAHNPPMYIPPSYRNTSKDAQQHTLYMFYFPRAHFQSMTPVAGEANVVSAFKQLHKQQKTININGQNCPKCCEAFKVQTPAQTTPTPKIEPGTPNRSSNEIIDVDNNGSRTQQSNSNNNATNNPNGRSQLVYNSPININQGHVGQDNTNQGLNRGGVVGPVKRPIHNNIPIGSGISENKRQKLDQNGYGRNIKSEITIEDDEDECAVIEDSPTTNKVKAENTVKNNVVDVNNDLITAAPRNPRQINEKEFPIINGHSRDFKTNSVPMKKDIEEKPTNHMQENRNIKQRSPAPEVIKRENVIKTEKDVDCILIDEEDIKPSVCKKENNTISSEQTFEDIRNAIGKVHSKTMKIEANIKLETKAGIRMENIEKGSKTPIADAMKLMEIKKKKENLKRKLLSLFFNRKIDFTLISRPASPVLAQQKTIDTAASMKRDDQKKTAHTVSRVLDTDNTIPTSNPKQFFPLKISKPHKRQTSPVNQPIISISKPMTVTSNGTMAMVETSSKNHNNFKDIANSQSLQPSPNGIPAPKTGAVEAPKNASKHENRPNKPTILQGRLIPVLCTPSVDISSVAVKEERSELTGCSINSGKTSSDTTHPSIDSPMALIDPLITNKPTSHNNFHSNIKSSDNTFITNAQRTSLTTSIKKEVDLNSNISTNPPQQLQGPIMINPQSIQTNVSAKEVNQSQNFNLNRPVAMSIQQDISVSNPSSSYNNPMEHRPLVQNNMVNPAMPPCPIKKEVEGETRPNAIQNIEPKNKILDPNETVSIDKIRSNTIISIKPEIGDMVNSSSNSDKIIEDTAEKTEETFDELRNNLLKQNAIMTSKQSIDNRIVSQDNSYKESIITPVVPGNTVPVGGTRVPTLTLKSMDHLMSDLRKQNIELTPIPDSNPNKKGNATNVGNRATYRYRDLNEAKSAQQQAVTNSKARNNQVTQEAAIHMQNNIHGPQTTDMENVSLGQYVKKNNSISKSQKESINVSNSPKPNQRRGRRQTKQPPIASPQHINTQTQNKKGVKISPHAQKGSQAKESSDTLNNTSLQSLQDNSNIKTVPWPPEKGTLIATVFEDGYYIGKVVSNLKKNDSVDVNYMRRYNQDRKDKIDRDAYEKYWIESDQADIYETHRESILGPAPILRNSLIYASTNKPLYELENYQLLSYLANNSLSLIDGTKDDGENIINRDTPREARLLKN